MGALSIALMLQNIRSALQLAAKAGHLECVKALLSAGADVNRVSNGGSPLLDAAAFGHVNVIKLLIDHKADIAVTWEGNTALHMAARFGRQAALEVLAPLVDLTQAVSAANDAGKTPLMLACSLSAGGEELVDYLLKAGADPTAADLALNTALHHAATSGNPALVCLLLAAGRSSQTMVNCKGRTPLHLAAVYGHQQVVELLTEQKQQDVVAQDEDGSTVLHMVCKSTMCNRSSQRQMAKVIVDAGVDMLAKDKAGYTAAYYAEPLELKQLVMAAESEAALSSESAASALGAQAGPVPQASAAELCSSAAGNASMANSSNAPTALQGKAHKIASALANMSGPIEPSPVTSSSEVAAALLADAWVVKEAIRQPSSEQQEWTLKAADASVLTGSGSQNEELRMHEDWEGAR
eukprot:gene13263-13393_t